MHHYNTLRKNYNMKNLTLLTALIITCFENRVLAQSHKNSNNIIQANNKQLEKAYKKAKPMRYCTGIRIEMNPLQYSFGEETFISYRIYSTHVRKNKTFNYIFSETSENIFNQLNSNKLNIELDGVDALAENNKILIKSNLINCKKGEFSLRANLKSHKKISAKKHINLLEYKIIGIDLWMPDEERFIKSTVNTQYKRKDTSDIDIYFKKLNSPIGKTLIYFSCINIALKDTIRGFMDTTSTIQFHFLSHLYRTNVIVDSTINLNKLYFKLIRIEPKYEIDKPQYDYHPLNEPIDKNMLMLERYLQIANENEQYMKDRKNVQIEVLPNYLFKF